MIVRIIGVAWLTLVLAPQTALGQADVRERARAVLSPPILEAVEGLVRDAEADGLPGDPLFAKALEGAAKGIPETRLVSALDGFAGRLRDAHVLLGPQTPAPLLVAGVDAMTRGVPNETIRALTTAERRPITLVVLGDLVQSGIEPPDALSVVREALSRRANDEALLDIPAMARTLMREQATTDEALAALRRRLRDSGGRVGAPAPPGSEPVSRDRRGSGG